MTREILHKLLDALIDKRDVAFKLPKCRVRTGRLSCVGEKYSRVLDRNGILHDVPTKDLWVKDKSPRRCSCGGPLKEGEEDCIRCRKILEGFNELFEAAEPHHIDTEKEVSSIYQAINKRSKKMKQAKERPDSFHEELATRFDNWWFEDGNALFDLTDAEIVTEFILAKAAEDRKKKSDHNNINADSDAGVGCRSESAGCPLCHKPLGSAGGGKCPHCGKELW